MLHKIEKAFVELDDETCIKVQQNRTNFHQDFPVAKIVKIGVGYNANLRERFFTIF